MTDKALLAIFRDSSLDQLAKAEASILRLETADPDAARKAVEAVFRAVHTVKGDAATLNCQELAQYCHALEGVLERLREGVLEPGPELATAFLTAFDALKAALTALAKGAPAGDALSLALLDPWLEGRQGGRDAPAAPEQDAPQEGLDLNYCVTAAQLDTLLDRLGEIMQSQARLAMLAREDADGRAMGLALDMERQLGLMGKCVLEMRLLPFQAVTPKYRRMVRDLAAASGKDVEFVVHGEKTELDKTLIEQINPALVHLLRNAVRHGLETPRARLMAGKPARGTLRLDVRQDGGEVSITVEDDGAGVDLDAVRARAVEAGLLDGSDRPAEAQLLDMIFLPGLTTSAQVDDVSGRGVGLDAVRAGLEELGGSVRVSSRPGRGAAFELRAPLSLSLMECLRVRIGRDCFYFPMECVESCRETPLGPDAHRPVGVFAPDDAVAACVHLDVALDIPGDRRPMRHVVVARHSGVRFGVAVDEVLGLAQVLVKPLDRKLLAQDSFLGAALGESGEMCLILDPRFLARLAAGSPEGA